MKKASKTAKFDLPILKDVVQPGKELPKSEMGQLPPALSELQLQSLNRQIEEIIQTHLQTTFKGITDDLVTKIKAHLDQKIPELAQLAIQQAKRE